MRTRRPLSINNSLVHGICNYSCRLCSVNKKNYNGPKEFQPFEVTRTLVRRIRESAQSGIYIRYVTVSGDGEPTLHPEFRSRIGMFGAMLRDWNISDTPRPEVSVVTNGSRLHLPGIEEAFTENDVTLIVSFPTVKPESYGAIMRGDAGIGASMLSIVLPNIERVMHLKAEGALSELCFHISPPETELIRSDFPDTLEYLTYSAHKFGLNNLELILFPAISNRSGLVRSSVVRVDMYRDMFRHFDNRVINNVRIRMKLVLKRFFSTNREIADLVRSFRFPCFWNANFFISADGSSICCNDQTVKYPDGNIMDNSIEELMERKEQCSGTKLCSVCNQSPYKLKGSPEALLYSYVARLRTKAAELHDRYTGFIEKVSGPDAGMEDTDSATDPSVDEIKRSETGKKKFADPTFPECAEDMEDAFKLIYGRYFTMGYQKPESSLMRICFHNLLPVCYPIIVKVNGMVAGTITVIREHSIRLPIEEYFKDEIDRIRTDDSLLCELSGLAVDALLPSIEGRNILLSLFHYAFTLSNDILGSTDFCMIINPRHSSYYEKVFNFVRIGGVKQCSTVNEAPAVPLHLNLKDAEVKMRKSNPELFIYFSEKGRKKTRERILNELRNQQRLFCSDFVENLSRNGNTLFENMTEDRKTILRSYYPEMRFDTLEDTADFIK
jgi:hypothetical protein